MIELFFFCVAVLLASSHAFPTMSEPLTSDPPLPTFGEPFLIPMRDGVILYSRLQKSEFPHLNGKAATVLIRTPYPMSSTCDNHKMFHCVQQWFRGRYLSQGNYSFFATEGDDDLDTQVYITAQKWSNGVVFTEGMSALGIAQYMALTASPVPFPPQLKFQFITVGSADMRSTAYQGGSFRHSLIEGWLTAIQEPATIALVRSVEADGSFWRPLNALRVLESTAIPFPSVHFAGWWDIFLGDQLLAFAAYKAASANNAFLIVVPTGHCAKGWVPWPEDKVGLGSSAANAISKALMQAGRDGHAVTTAGADHIALYVMGNNIDNTGNFWIVGDSFPEFTPTRLYFTRDFTLAEAPGASVEPLSFVFDPTDPVPSIGGDNLVLPKCGPWPQDSVLNRTDVLVFTSPAATSAVYLIGPLTATLNVSSSANDTDFTVKVMDQFKLSNGTTVNVLLQDSVVRMRWRNGFATDVPSWIQPGAFYQVEVNVWNTSFVLAPGHRLAVAISSSNSPRFEPNLNNGRLLSEGGEPVKALNTVVVGGSSSFITLPVVNPSNIAPADMDAFIAKALKSIKTH